MALFYSEEISTDTKLAIWKIEESEAFFTQFASMQYPISHPQKRLQHLAGRYLLQYLFSDFPIHYIQISSSGKPIIENNRYNFSLSHCGNFAAAIVSKTKNVGIDIEQKRIAVAKVAHRFLHREEIQMLKHIENNYHSTDIESLENTNALFSSNIDTLTLLWSAKEAIYKWWGIGNLEFNEMIRIDNWQKSNEGIINARILSNDSIFDLLPNYRFFDDLCLVWLSENIKG